MISALPNSEPGRDAVSDRGRSWRICEKKHLLAPTQSLIQQELGASYHKPSQWAEKKDTACNTRSMKPCTSFCYVLSLTEVMSPYGTAIGIKLTSVLDNCFSVCMSSIRDGHPYLAEKLISYRLFSLFLMHELLLSLDPHSSVFHPTQALHKSY